MSLYHSLSCVLQCQSVRLPACQSVYQCLCFIVCLHVRVSLSIIVKVGLSVCLCLYICVSWFVFLSVSLSGFIYIYIYIYLCIIVCLSVCLSVCYCIRWITPWANTVLLNCMCFPAKANRSLNAARHGVLKCTHAYSTSWRDATSYVSRLRQASTCTYLRVNTKCYRV